jgi:hypothetical protein
MLAPGHVDWIARGGDDIYFSRDGTTVFHVTEAGEEVIVTDVPGWSRKVNSDSIVWVDDDHPTQPGLYRAARSAGSTAEFVAEIAPDVAIQATYLTDDAFYYWSSSPSEIAKIALSDGTKQTLFTNMDAEGLQVHDGFLYFNADDVGDHSIKRVPEAGGAPERLTPLVFSLYLVFAVGEGEVFWAIGTSGKIYRTPFGSPDTRTDLGTTDYDPLFAETVIVLEGDRLYWINTQAIGYYATSGSECGLAVSELSHSFLSFDSYAFIGHDFYFADRFEFDALYRKTFD